MKLHQLAPPLGETDFKGNLQCVNQGLLPSNYEALELPLVDNQRDNLSNNAVISCSRDRQRALVQKQSDGFPLFLMPQS